MKIKLFHIISLLLFSQALFSQADTLEVGQDTLKPSEEKYDRIYKLFLEDRGREIKRLWKLNLVDMAKLGPNLSIEQGLGKSFTSETYLGLKELTWGGLYGFGIDAEFNQQLKFYFNINARERKGKRYQGFSANYISISAFSSFQLIPFEKYVPQLNNPPSSIIRSRVFKNGVGLYLGMQRRIGNIGYIDLFAGVKFYQLSYKSTYFQEHYNIFDGNTYSGSYLEAMPVIGLRAGFAIDSFKNLKYMLK